MADQNQPRPCIFCAIAEGKIPAKKVYEDPDCIGFLDINPRSKGMTIVIPRRHYSKMNDEPSTSTKIMQGAQNVAKMIQDSLGPDSVALAVMPAEEVPHFHVKLYPIYGEERPIFEGQPNKAGEQELDAVAARIKSASVNLFAPQKRDEPEAERSEEDVKYIKSRVERA